MENKSVVTAFIVLLLFVTLWPITENWKQKPIDRFPLSYYPMFSQKRADTYTLNYLIGYDSGGNRHLIPYTYAGSGGFNQVRRQINKQAKKGSKEKLTKKVAKRVAKIKAAPFNELVRIELVKGTYHLDSFLRYGDKSAITETVVNQTIIDRYEAVN